MTIAAIAEKYNLNVSVLAVLARISYACAFHLIHGATPGKKVKEKLIAGLKEFGVSEDDLPTWNDVENMENVIREINRDKIKNTESQNKKTEKCRKSKTVSEIVPEISGLTR